MFRLLEGLASWHVFAPLLVFGGIVLWVKRGESVLHKLFGGGSRLSPLLLWSRWLASWRRLVLRLRRA